MKKLLLIAIAGLVSASTSWGLSFTWDTPLTGPTPVALTTAPGFSEGGNPARFFPPGVDNSWAGDGVSQVSPGTPELGDFVSVMRIGNILGQTSPFSVYHNFGGDVEIWGILYGIDDVVSTNTVDGFGDGEITVQAENGRLELWLVSPTNSALVDNQISHLGHSGARGSGAGAGATYTNVTDNGAVPFVAFDLRADGSGITDERTIVFSGGVVDTDGNIGGFLADVDDSWANYNVYGKAFDTNGRADGTDLEVDYTMNPPSVNAPPGAMGLDFGVNPMLTSIQPIPEPSTLILLGTGLLGMVGYARRRQQA